MGFGGPRWGGCWESWEHCPDNRAHRSPNRFTHFLSELRECGAELACRVAEGLVDHSKFGSGDDPHHWLITYSAQAVKGTADLGDRL